MDHANIYVFIAATYTPLALLALQPASGTVLLIVHLDGRGSSGWSSGWSGSAPRAGSTPRCYIAMGWAAVGWLPQIYASGGSAVFYLIIAGGLLYTRRRRRLRRKRPNPSPRWFGFHEIFHSCTIAAFVAHYIAISILTYAA